MTSVDIFSQGVAINSSGTSADPSAMLDISSTDKGILIPRMTEAQRLLISNPAIGLIVYQIDNTTGFWYYDGNTWTELSAGQAGSGSMAPGSAAGNTTYWDGIQWVVNSSNIYNNGGSVGIGTTSPDQSATLEVGGINTGFLLSRLTTAQRNNIQNPASGLQIYNTTTKCFEFYESGYWQTLKCACVPPATPVASLHTSTSSSITWNWNASSGAIGYKYNTTNSYNTATDLGNVTTFTQTGLSSNVTYTLYIWAYNASCESQAAIFTEVTALLASPVANYISERLFEIQWNWKTVSGATGYKYNTINDYATAIDNGSSTYYSQTGLKCDSTFILYVWAYNASGHSNAGALTGNTGSMCGPCTGGQPYRTATSITWYWGDCCWGDQTIYYKYNTVNDFNTATDLGTTMYVTQTGLTCNTNY